MKNFEATKFLFSMILILTLACIADENREVRNQDFEIKKKGALPAETPYKLEVAVNGKSGGEMYSDPPGCFFPWVQNFFNNETFTIENKGQTPVKNPWITAEGHPDFFSAQTIAGSVLSGITDEGVKARTLYEFNRKFFAHEYLGTGDNSDPVKMFNVYGYGICGDNAVALGALYRTAGFQTRKGRPYGHSTFEVKYGGKFRLLDGDVMIFGTDYDNSSIIGEEDIARDPYLLKRTHTYGLKNWGWSNNRDEVAAGLFWYNGPRTLNHENINKHTMAFELRPSEKITWIWKERLKPLGLYQTVRKEAKDKHFHGQLELLLSSGNASGFKKDDGLLIPFRLPYPFAGITAALKVGTADKLEVSLSKDGKVFKPVQTGLLEKGISGDEFLTMLGLKREEMPAYEMYVMIKPKGADINTLLPLTLKPDFQFAPKSMPQLHVGKNAFKYRDESESRDLRISLTWKENQNTPPNAPAKPVFPANDGKIKGVKAFTFEWAPAADPDGTVSDYHFQLSEFEDFRFPLSSNFDAMLSLTETRGTPKFKIQHDGLLNPGKKYYWRVRARDDKGCWGNWGGPWSFTIDGPGTPVIAQTAKSDGPVKFTWSVAGGTSKPVKYLVYGSAYRGFTPSRTPFKMISAFVGNETFTDMPPTLLFETDKAEVEIKPGEAKNLFPFYRVQAVDAEGNTGCFSAQVEVPGPLLLSDGKITAPKDATKIPLPILSSAGRLINLEGGGYRYGIALEDRWGVEIISSKGADDLKVKGGKSCIELSRPLKVGEKLSCEANIFGISYGNMKMNRKYQLEITGGAATSEDKPVQPPVTNLAKSATPALKDDFDADTLNGKGRWSIEDSAKRLQMRKLGNEWFVFVTQAAGDSYVGAALQTPLDPLKIGTVSEKDSKTVFDISFSLVFSLSETNCKCEIRMNKKDGDWDILTIVPWKQAILARKMKSGTKSVPSLKSFNYEYNVPVDFRWTINSGGKHALYQGDVLLNEWDAVPDENLNSADITGFRIAIMINGENDGGSLGFGNFRVSAFK